MVKSFLLILTLGAGQDLAMPPAGHGYHTRPQINDLGATIQVDPRTPRTLVKKYLGGGVVVEGCREGGSGGCTEPPGNEYYRWLVVEILAVWSRSLHSFLKEEVRELVSHSVVYYELPWDTSSHKSIVHLVVLK